MFRKKHKNLKAICHSKPKIFSVGQPWWPQFFQDLEPPSPPNFFSAATALEFCEIFKNIFSYRTPLVPTSERCSSK